MGLFICQLTSRMTLTLSNKDPHTMILTVLNSSMHWSLKSLEVFFIILEKTVKVWILTQRLYNKVHPTKISSDFCDSYDFLSYFAVLNDNIIVFWSVGLSPLILPSTNGAFWEIFILYQKLFYDMDFISISAYVWV